MLRYELREVPGESVTLWPSGSFTREDWTARLRHFLEDHPVNDGVQTILLDLSEGNEIDLEGVATLLILLKESADRGKRFMTRNARGQVRDKFTMTAVLARLEGQ